MIKAKSTAGLRTRVGRLRMPSSSFLLKRGLFEPHWLARLRVKSDRACNSP